MNLAVAYAGGTLGELLRRNQAIARLQRDLQIFVGLGLRLAWQRIAILFSLLCVREQYTSAAEAEV